MYLADILKWERDLDGAEKKKYTLSTTSKECFQCLEDCFIF